MSLGKIMCKKVETLLFKGTQKKSIIKGVIHPTSYGVVAKLTGLFSKL